MRGYGKLVRDKIPEIIRAKGELPTTRILGEDEYLEELVKKLGEEYEEFKVDISVEELADLQEVILALADAIGGREELEKVRVQKAEARGIFKDKVFLEGVKSSDE
jgi:predicted house-cleaning noncanonical NTP pyrophosphatase (MazG superfamily)